jgi:GT2 family glycosyltransferase
VRDDPPGGAPGIALIICTRDRAAQLPALFAALAALRAHVAWELVLVDNGSRDDTPRLLRELAPSLGVPAAIVEEPRAGLGRARNAGVRRARAPLVAFTDDDCYPAADYLDRVADALADPALAFIGGRILPFDLQDDPITTRSTPEVIAIPARSVVPTGLVQGANMAFRREVLDRIGGFDDALGPGTPFCNDDVDAVARASAAGFAGAYVPGPVVRHHHRRRAPEEVAALERSYDHGRGAYYAKAMLDLPTRGSYARHWWQTMQVIPRHRTAREIAGAAEYCLRRLTRRLG